MQAFDFSDLPLQASQADDPIDFGEKRLLFCGIIDFNGEAQPKGNKHSGGARPVWPPKQPNFAISDVAWAMIFKLPALKVRMASSMA
ncbi:hypothetical protein [Marinobacter adhaerens]|uniref:hypothetical protein n=1 Tax=Marinobacter adhaerens TaxID=1033846 RepID=UPI003D14EF84